ncbi:MAG: glutaredoxin family protein [Proteobacteria bacterium]|nr:glutaredoxin family protein [Pseudomonadota bacterium]
MSAEHKLTVLSREWCHLCHDLVDALTPLQQELGFVVEVVDVDAFPALEELWSEKVPVVLAGDTELCHYFLDEAAVRAHFQRIG